MLVSTFTSSQVAAVFITAILTILPTTQPSRGLAPAGLDPWEWQRLAFGTLRPTTYYMHAPASDALHQGPGGGRPAPGTPSPWPPSSRSSSA